ncbi:Agamous-like MADS-box protein AGL80 [Acorus gramineus]|uniref:Agamous-like MADS-box protein AGL80 n=1 Tax=Acorus gramineus TaxID=55184 RepID=A0AAV9BYE8_ACOGR|nr:Agamous-like MADS-box protein AGL80 [Acorus gramineus]
MSRKKVNISWIANDGAQRVTLTKRRKGLVNKMREITTLCRVMGSKVIYDSEKEDPMEAWLDKIEAQSVFHDHMELPESQRNRKSLDMKALFHHRLTKYMYQLNRIEKVNRAKQLDIFALKILQGEGLRGLFENDINHVFAMVENRTQILGDTADVMRQRNQMHQQQPLPMPQKEASEAREKVKGGGWELLLMMIVWLNIEMKFL